MHGLYDCMAFVNVMPNLEGLIISRRTAENRKLRFFINFERKIEENSYTDWTVKSSNNKQHSTFCVAQIPFHLREFSQYIAETGTPLEIQNDRRKYSRFGPGQPLMRAFRTVHTKKSVISGYLAIDQTKLRLLWKLTFQSARSINS